MLPLKPDAVSTLIIKKSHITYRRPKDIKVVIDTSKKYLSSTKGFKLDL
tara:strand:+ start:537 stop:683 length:147 start_codon:yes stop_codon:yes gene_type:complete